MDTLIKLNENLKIFNQESGEYLLLIGNKDKIDVIPDNEVKINDLDNGSIGNVLEFEKRLSLFLIEQLDISKAKTIYLDDILNTFYGKYREVGETDSTFYQRVLQELFHYKCTLPAIYDIAKNLADPVQIQEGGMFGFFADTTYADNVVFFDDSQGIVTESAMVDFKTYFFIVIVKTITPDNYRKMVNMLADYHASGINYIILITEQTAQYSAFFGTSYYGYNGLDLGVNPVITKDFFGG